jgi:hypothetical protein
MKNVVTLPVVVIYFDSNLLDAKFCTSVKKIIKLQKENQEGIWRSDICFTSGSGGFFGKYRFSFVCKSGIVEMERNSSNRIVLESVTGLVGKVERRPRKCQNAISEVGRKNYRKLRKLLKGTTEKPRKKYLENIQYTIYNIQYTIYNIQYTIYNIQYTIYNIQYTCRFNGISKNRIFYLT